MFTLYYVGATFLQCWRNRCLSQKIQEQISEKTCVSFYVLPDGQINGYNPSLAASDLCINRSTAMVTEILWLQGRLRGCCLKPPQILQITPFISFPPNDKFVPFVFTQTPAELIKRLKNHNNREEIVHLLIELEVKNDKSCLSYSEDDFIWLEDYGMLIAWKMDSHIAVLLQTNVEYFTKLLVATFLQNKLIVNDHLSIIRIETIDINGSPQPFEKVSSHLPTCTRASSTMTNQEWHKHFDNLRLMSVFASQAVEFSYNKNRTEGKTGVVRPDLIPNAKRCDEHDSIKEIRLGNREHEGTQSRLQENLSLDELKMDEIPRSSSSVNATTGGSIVGVHHKMKAKPTVIKKTLMEPLKVSTTNSNSTNISNSSNNTTTSKISPSKISTKQNDLEKIAAASVAQRQKSPLHGKSIKESEQLSKIEENAATTNTVPNTKATISSASSKVSDSLKELNTKRPSLRRNKISLKESKPLNILVYTDSSSARENAIAALKDILEKDMYTIYSINSQQVIQKHWIENTMLLVVCGTVASNIGEILLDYFLNGGKVLSLCSDILHFVLPNYRTAEVREHELVQFSYNKWQKVKMMHHIFCYQPSPVKKNFSTESDTDTLYQANAKKSALVCPRSIELKDLHGELHNLDVQVLGTEETWNTPSLLLANNIKSGGKAVFSQIHLETHPNQFEMDEIKYSILIQNEKIRLEILADLLSRYLNVRVHQNINATTQSVDLYKGNNCTYPNAYFLGHHESKFELLDKLKEKSFGLEKAINTSKLTIQFCAEIDKPIDPSNTNVLPILIHSCPDDFSTVKYFQNLNTKYVGRLVVYTPIINSSMNVINELELMNGIAVLPRQQTDGTGRGGNQWLSPVGCAMFSVQLHIPINTPLGSRLPLIQHIFGAAIVNALRSHDIYKVLDISLKWPNDIYANGVNKIGGLIVNTIMKDSQVIVNNGTGINLNNSKPTLCINDMINEYNHLMTTSIPPLEYEEFVAIIFNEIERIFELVQSGDFESFYKLYYDLWLHDEQNIKIVDENNIERETTIIGIDEYGFLKVKNCTTGSIETVMPDGNSFDMLKGLIIPKSNSN